MPDFRAFLKPTEPVVLPYFGGTRVDAADRRFKVDAEIEPGWWRFAIEGRKAVPKDRADPVDLGALPAMRGHWVAGYIVVSGRELAPIVIPPAEEPAALAKITARRWYSGDVLLDSIEFEDDAELSARSALEEKRGIGDVRGIVPSLRAAFGYALGMATAREERVPATLRELAGDVLAIAERGHDAARGAIQRIVTRRIEAEAAMRARALVEAVNRDRAKMREIAEKSYRQRRGGSPVERADAALEAAGARMISARRAGANELEVTFVYEGVRIIATVDPETLHVYDSGICLAGADEELTLDSLPSVIKEAIDADHLNITRHG
ncbi:MAG: hypothetical protein M4D80_08235 [Myxococcota bacterium]|nr:hypothetical protein [Myxococcota bacterium]